MGTIEQDIEQWAKSTLPVYEFMDLSRKRGNWTTNYQGNLS